MRIHVLSLASLVLVACSPGSIVEEPPGDDSDLIGGTIDTGDPSVILLFAQRNGSTLGNLCTATVITPTVLITAAHCVSANVVGTDVTFTAYTGPDFNNNRGAALPVARVEWDRAFNINDLRAGHDIGVVYLRSPVGMASLPYNISTAPRSGQQVRLVGYGNNNGPSASGSGVKRQLTTTLESVTANLLHLRGNGTGTCQGDSGGPEFMNINGVETIVGLSSYSITGCPGGGSHTRVDAFAGLLAEWTRNQGGGECGTAFRTGGAIGAEYQRLGGCGSFLGAPTTNENATACEGGRYSGFQNGAITWNPQVGAHETHGGIRAKWQALGFECGILGLPTTNETNTACGGGKYNGFQRGAITWTPAAGAHETHGPIRDRWGALGFECSYLGFPTSDVYAASGGSRSDFEGGTITVAANGTVTDQRKACTTNANCKPGGSCAGGLCQ